MLYITQRSPVILAQLVSEIPRRSHINSNPRSAATSTHRARIDEGSYRYTRINHGNISISHSRGTVLHLPSFRMRMLFGSLSVPGTRRLEAKSR